MKPVLKFLTALVVCAFMGAALSHVLPIDQGMATMACLAASAGMSFVQLPQGVANAVALQQLWESEMLTAFRATRTWQGRIPRKDKYVNNNVINLTEIGADPTVLINNTSFPIATAQRTDDNVALALNRYDTTNTKITRAEMYALPYDKQDSAVRQHKETLIEKTGEHGLFNLCPAGNSATTPVIATTGGDNGNGRKRLKSADLIKLKQRLDNMKIPKAGRILVLCGDHVADLLLEDQSFAMRYNNTKTGEVIPQYGFEIFEDVYNPVFDASMAKKAYGATAAGTDCNASTLFFAPRAFQATGDVEAFLRDKSQDPENRATVLGYGLYHIIAPMKTTGFGAIVGVSTT